MKGYFARKRKEKTTFVRDRQTREGPGDELLFGRVAAGGRRRFLPAFRGLARVPHARNWHWFFAPRSPRGPMRTVFGRIRAQPLSPFRDSAPPPSEKRATKKAKLGSQERRQFLTDAI